jgi:3',5'-cyclic AMP phosphodiesterase CpdA
MKLIHISDIHLHTQPVLDLDPVDNFEKCLAHVERFHADADRIVITGDLTHRGLTESYVHLRDRMEASPLKGERAPRLIMGNHDDRENFLSIFSDSPRDANGHVQWTEETPVGLFIYMDTAERGTDCGVYGPERRAWLDAALTSAAKSGQGAYLFMHHNPLTVHVANADMIGFVEEQAVQDVLLRHRDTVRHIFFGHCHYTLSGTVHGVPFSAPRSTNHACWPDFSGIATRMGYGALQPNYNVCFIKPHGTVIHSIDFLDEGKVKWREDS